MTRTPYLDRYRDDTARRHIARRNPSGWYRTIDRIVPSRVARPKLLVPDIKGEAASVHDEGRYYPHPNLHFVISDEWELRALQVVLKSSLSVVFVATCCTRRAGGCLRCQAQHRRRVRVPRWR